MVPNKLQGGRMKIEHRWGPKPGPCGTQKLSGATEEEKLFYQYSAERQKAPPAD